MTRFKTQDYPHETFITKTFTYFFAIFVVSFSFLNHGAEASNSMTINSSDPSKKSTEVAIVAAGCFWCIEKDIDKVNGVLETTVGYIGGSKETATYEQTSSGKTGHYEALRIVFDPSVVSYAEILDVVWVNLDPFNAGGQFCDKGPQYRAAIFPTSKTQRDMAQKSLEKVQKWLNQHSKDPQAKSSIATQIIDATQFYDAEEYHQDYYKKNPVRYGFYRTTCGRDRRLKEVWDDLKRLPAKL